ncbi:hypothetical protein ACFFV7_41805 [Nonomuraea spiralis]|uniref:Uncharacterized protein n=1 Tax=Nonomuraea spiralis TaxID=46182 RepID=A0ABV5ITD3_9ACTN|nr:hypothetical protein [Nonomuraea spiralis]
MRPVTRATARARSHERRLRGVDRKHGVPTLRDATPGGPRRRARAHPSGLLPAEDKPAAYARLARELPPGLSEWAVHPSLATLTGYRTLQRAWSRA